MLRKVSIGTVPKEEEMKKKKQCLVIGLGIYGMSVARKLSEEGIEVLAIEQAKYIIV